MSKRTKILLVFLIAILIFGILIILFPITIRLIREKNRAGIVDQYLIQEINEEARQAEFEICQQYNKLLIYKQRKMDIDENGNAIDYSLLDTYDDRLSFSSMVMGVVEIPKIGLKIPFYHRSDQETLDLGAGHMQETSLPIGGISTHAVISAHNGDPYSDNFSQIDRLEIGDKFNVTVAGVTMTYEVDQIKTVLPTDTDDTKVIEGEDYVTLLTCTPRNINTHRLLVRGKRTDDMATDDLEKGWSETMLYALLASVIILLIIMEISYVLIRRHRSKKALKASAPASHTSPPAENENNR